MCPFFFVAIQPTVVNRWRHLRYPWRHAAPNLTWPLHLLHRQLQFLHRLLVQLLLLLLPTALLQQDLRRFRFVVTTGVAQDIPWPPYAGHARADADANGSADVANADSSADDAAADGRRRRNDVHADGHDATAVAAAADGADAVDNDADGEPSLDSEWVFLAADGVDASASANANANADGGNGDVDVDACEDVEVVVVGRVDASACADVATYVVDVAADVAGVAAVGLWASHCLLLALWACRALCVTLAEWAWLLLLLLLLLLLMVLWQVIRVHPARIVMMMMMVVVSV